MQVGYLAIALLGAATAWGVREWIAEGPSLGVGFAIALLLVLLVLFSHQTVEVTERELRTRFGLGRLGVSVGLVRVRDVRIVRNPWWYGWGIRFTPGGMVYNVAGTWAVEVETDGGGTVRIGTDEPQELYAALRDACPRLS